MNRHFLLFTLSALLPAATIAAEAEVVLGPEKPVKDEKGNVKAGVLDTPFAVDFDQDDNIYIVEYTGGRIHRMSPDGKLVHIGGQHRTPGYGGDGGPALEATFQDMHNVVVLDNGDLLISDHKNNAVRRFHAADQTVTTYAGNRKAGFSGDGGPADKASFNMVMSVGLSPDGQTLTVADIRNRRIRGIDLKSGTVTTLAGNGQKGIPEDGTPALDAPLADPRAAEFDRQGNLYIVERGGHALRVVKPDGKIHTVVGSGKKGLDDGPALKATMNGPKHLAIDADGNVYIADDNNHAVRKYDPKTEAVSTILGKGDIQLNRPHGVTVHKGWLYVADSWNHRVLRVRL